MEVRPSRWALSLSINHMLERAWLVHSLGGLSGDGEEKLELGRELILSVEAVGEIDSSDTAVSVNLHSKINEETN